MTRTLVTPPENWQGATEIPDAALPILERLARQYGGTYREDGRKIYFHPTKPAAVARTEVQGQGDLKLPVRYYSQLNSQYGNQALRMCQSSSLAMLVKSIQPGALSDEINADDDYLQRVLSYGDTTLQTAQLKALKHVLTTADVEFCTDLNWKDVDAQLKRGIPVPIGILHHGDLSHPTGGGHWVCVVGRKADGSAYYVHDPAGELDLVAGRYVGTDGKYQVYSAANLGRRWMCDDSGNYTPGRGWGYIATPRA